MAPSTAGSTAARSPSSERARRRASRDGAVPPAPPGHHGQWPSPLRSVEREGGGKNELGFGPRRRRRGFDLAKTADVRPIEINGRESVSLSGSASGPGGRGSGRRGGPFRRPGRLLSGLGPKEGWPSRPRAGFAPGLVDGPFGRGEVTPRRADSAARPLAVGPRAQVKVAEQAAGRFCFWAA